MSYSLRLHEQQHARPPCPSTTPGVQPNPCPLSQWCHPIILSSVVPFSSCPQSFPASGSFQISQLFTTVGQSIGISASKSVLPMSTEDWFPLAWTGWISLLSRRPSRVFSNSTIQKHQFFSAQLGSYWKKKKKNTEELQNNQKANNKIVTSTYLSIITLNNNGINAPIKRQRMVEWI